ncbi:hypothetical protein AA15669_0931 [Saccharibacter floricola DSM 15669]|uniref:Uncharacterized protein n=1 Tax=Saccharibacter floricola DSM 15669 TaxID=1123227 RepID=A0ABQ0NYH1_9PROT|nr:hypothetical protein AA15669_0931 [Saccharibacter floricola DSM 15669]
MLPRLLKRLYGLVHKLMPEKRAKRNGAWADAVVGRKPECVDVSTKPFPNMRR